MFNFNHLHYFYVVARSESLTFAAKELQVSQPALSSQIKTLESSLGRHLFVRVGRKLQLTSDGKMVFGHCRKIFEAASDLSKALQLDSVETGERITFGVSEELDRPFAAEMASHLLKKDQPANLAIRMNSADHFVLLEQLQNRSVDVVLTNQPAMRPSLVNLLKISMPVRAYAAPKLRKSAHLKRSDHSIDGERGLVLPSPGQKLRAEAEAFLFEQKNNFRGHLVFEGNVMASLVRAVVDGMGVGFFPRPYVESEIKSGRLVEVSDRDLWQHQLYLVGCAGFDENSRVGAFRDDTKRSCESLGCQVS